MFPPGLNFIGKLFPRLHQEPSAHIPDHSFFSVFFHKKWKFKQCINEIILFQKSEEILLGNASIAFVYCCCLKILSNVVFKTLFFQICKMYFKFWLLDIVFSIGQKIIWVLCRQIIDF